MIPTEKSMEANITDHDLRILAQDWVKEASFEDANATSFAAGYKTAISRMRSQNDALVEKEITMAFENVASLGIRDPKIDEYIKKMTDHIIELFKK